MGFLHKVKSLKSPVTFQSLGGCFAQWLKFKGVLFIVALYYLYIQHISLRFSYFVIFLKKSYNRYPGDLIPIIRHSPSTILASNWDKYRNPVLLYK